MKLYTVSTIQLLVCSVLIATIGAAEVIAYSQYKEQQVIPQVQVNPDGTCVKVLNFNNGEAYNCQDVDVLLRRYKKVPAI